MFSHTAALTAALHYSAQGRYSLEYEREVDTQDTQGCVKGFPPGHPAWCFLETIVNVLRNADLA